MRIAFRTDASSQIGTGHVMRCLTLADALEKQGSECRFICRAHEGHLIDYIRYRGYSAHPLLKPQVKQLLESGSDDTHWSGTDWLSDAQETHRVLANTKFDWMIVDHYALDHRWELEMRPFCKHVMAIDDLADRQHDCDLLLDQNYGSSVERYRGLVPSGCKQCYGPVYALLNPVYAERRVQLLASVESVRRALIYFGGGSDVADLTGLAVHAFQAPELAHIELDIVVGAAYAHQSSLEELAAECGKAVIHRQLPDLAGLMAKADLAVGAGGVTTWERCCMGLPAIVISIAENQRPACEAMSSENMIDYVGHIDQVTSELIQDRILCLRNNAHLLRRMSERGMNLVDGCGTNRILNVVGALS